MIEKMAATPYERVKIDMVRRAGRNILDICSMAKFTLQANGAAGPSLARDLLTSLNKDELTPEMDLRIKWTTGIFSFTPQSTSPLNVLPSIYVRRCAFYFDPAH